VHISTCTKFPGRGNSLSDFFWLVSVLFLERMTHQSGDAIRGSLIWYTSCLTVCKKLTRLNDNTDADDLRLRCLSQYCNSPDLMLRIFLLQMRSLKGTGLFSFSISFLCL